QIVLALQHVGEVVRESRRLVARNIRRAIAQTGKIRERDSRRAIVDRVLRSPGDSQFRRDILRVREVRRGQVAAAADGKVRAVVDARPEAVAPARSEVQARTLASIQKAE